MGMVCDNCGRENEDEFKFCLGCGSELEEPQEEDDEPEMIDCPHCGSRVPGQFKFCGQCGGSLEDVGEDEPPAEAESLGSEGTEPSVTAPAQESGSETRLGELTVIRPDGTEGATIPLTEAGLTVGRNSDFDVLADDPFLSPSHAEIRYEEGELVVRDLESANGVFWRLADDVELEDGDLLRIGQELIRYRDFESVEPVVDQGADEVPVQGSPDPGIWGRLVLVGGPELPTRAFALSGDSVTIGREIGAILFRDDGFVSGKHAKIYRDGDSVYFRDLGSSNGSYIRLREERTIGDGDLVLMGQQLLQVDLD